MTPLVTPFLAIRTMNRVPVHNASAQPLARKVPHSDNYAVIGHAPEIVIKDHYWVCADTGAAGNAIDFLFNTYAGKGNAREAANSPV
jgi:hypothetical protein